MDSAKTIVWKAWTKICGLFGHRFEEHGPYIACRHCGLIKQD